MLAAKVGIRRSTDCRILGRDGTATKKIAAAVLSRVIGNAFPEQTEDDEIAMLRVNAGATEFNHFRSQSFKARELEFLRTVVAKVFRSVRAGLQTIRSDDMSRRKMLDDQMITYRIERVGVQAGRVGLFESFVEFEVE